MDVCLRSQDGEVRLPRHMKARPDAWLTAMAPYRDARVIAVACLFPWYWRAALCAQEGRPGVLGHALSRKAIQGGKTQNDQMDAQHSAVLRRGGLLPQASVYPAAMRATRDRLRRRTHGRRTRAELLAHIQQTQSQSPRPEMGPKIASKAHRDGVAERCPAPAVQQRLAVDRARLGHDDPRRRDGALSIRTTATQPQAPTRARLRTVPGLGELLRFGLLYAIHASTRFPRVPDCLSSCRLVKGTQASAGKRSGTAGTQSGHAPRTWAFSAAAVRLLRANPAGQQDLTNRENKHGSGTALPRLGQQRGRPVYALLPRPTAFARGQLLHGEGSGAEEPHASRDNHGRSLRVGLCHACGAAAWNAEEHRGPCARILWPVLGPPRRLLSRSDRRVSLPWAAPPPRLRRTGARHPGSHPCAEDGTRGQRGF